MTLIKSLDRVYGFRLWARDERGYIPPDQEQSGNEAAREQLIEQNTGLVKNIALKFAGTGYEFEDLLQIGFSVY